MRLLGLVAAVGYLTRPRCRSVVLGANRIHRRHTDLVLPQRSDPRFKQFDTVLTASRDTADLQEIQDVFRHVESFVRDRIDRGSLVISISGGVDSMVLSHCLVLLRHSLPLDLSAVHINYNTRSSSQLEAAFVETWAKAAELQLTVLPLEAAASRAEFETESRLRRYEAYREAVRRSGAVAVVTGHHEDDAAENVLSNLFMGRSLFHLPVMGPEARIEAVRIWRPFYNLPKRALYAFANSYDIPFLRNNDAPSGRRAVVRRQVIPVLEESFGQRTMRNIARVGRSAKDWKGIIDEHILSPFWRSVLYYPHGAILPSDRVWPAAFWEEAFVGVFHAMGCTMLSKRSLDRLISAIQADKSAWLPIHRQLILFVDSTAKRVVILNSELFPESPSQLGSWKMSEREVSELGDIVGVVGLLKGFLLLDHSSDLPQEIAA